LRTSNTGFDEKFADLLSNTEFTTDDLQTKAETLDRIVDKGIVEFSLIETESRLDYIETFGKIVRPAEEAAGLIKWLIDNPQRSNLAARDFDLLLDIGVVVYSLPVGGIMIVSVERALKFLETINTVSV
jgi:hypothetical protein